MPFQYTLANLLASNDGAIAALFLDERAGAAGHWQGGLAFDEQGGDVQHPG